MAKREDKLRAVVEAIIARGETVEALAALSGLHLRATSKRSRGGGARSKQKGRTFMTDVAALLTRTFGLEEGDVFVKATSQVGCDLHLSPRASRAFPYSVEGKNVEALNIWAALLQADKNAEPGRPPIVFFTRAHSPIYVALAAEVFLERLVERSAEKSGEGDPGGVRPRGEG